MPRLTPTCQSDRPHRARTVAGTECTPPAEGDRLADGATLNPATVGDLAAVACPACGHTFARRYSAVRPETCAPCAPTS